VLLLVFFFLSPKTIAATTGGMITVAPIVQMEKAQKSYPTPHTKTRTMYGAQVLLGPSFIQLEVEGTYGTDDETYDNGVVDKETVQKLKLGLRGRINHAGLISLYVRSGAQAKQTELERTQSGVTTKTKGSVYVDPYAGGGVSVRLTQGLKAHAGYTVIFSDYPNKGEKEYQSEIGVSMAL